MKIILSPSKLYKRESIFKRHRQVGDIQKSNHLRRILQDMTYHQLSKFTGLKSKSADAVYELYNRSEILSLDPFGMYDGIVFKEINANSYDDTQKHYLKNHGIVLSAMYGALEADMKIQPYRLDMTKRLDGVNLYDYWQKSIDDYFLNVDIVVNLASLEFSKMLRYYQGRLLNIHFKEEQSNGAYKVITVRAKQARGLMFDYMVSNCIENLSDLKAFNGAGYQYDEQLSNRDNWYFIKPYGDI